MIFRLFLRSLHHRHDWHGNPFKRGMTACKYAARSAALGRVHWGWLQFVYDTPAMTAMLARDPRLLERPQHVYINRMLARPDSYAIIESHYRYLLAHWPTALVARIYHASDGASLGHLHLKDGHQAELRLFVPAGRHREGELALYLLDARGQTLSSLVFTIADNGRSLLIGRLQGAAPGLGRDVIRDFTRQAHGLRPKNLLLSMMYALATSVGITRILGVANHAHPFAGRPDKIKADYDTFWQECRGEAHSDGFYWLPASEPARNEMLIESKHRSAFRKREVLRRQAANLLQMALTAPPIEFARSEFARTA